MEIAVISEGMFPVSALSSVCITQQAVQSQNCERLGKLQELQITNVHSQLLTKFNTLQLSQLPEFCWERSSKLAGIFEGSETCTSY